MSEVATSLVRPRPSPLHSGIGVGTFLTLQILATLFPLTAGLLLYGWRAAGTTAVVVGSAMATMAILRQVGWHGRQVRLWHCLWLATIVSLMLPAHLFTFVPVNGRPVWPILPAAGITLALLSWLLGGLGTQRVPPSVVTILMMFVLFHEVLVPRYVLRLDRMFTGICWMRSLLREIPRKRGRGLIGGRRRDLIRCGRSRLGMFCSRTRRRSSGRSGRR